VQQIQREQNLAAIEVQVTRNVALTTVPAINARNSFNQTPLYSLAIQKKESLILALLGYLDEVDGLNEIEPYNFYKEEAKEGEEEVKEECKGEELDDEEGQDPIHNNILWALL